MTAREFFLAALLWAFVQTIALGVAVAHFLRGIR